MQLGLLKTPDPVTKQRGFTIVELLIVIVVIAILAGIVIVAYNGISSKARASALISTLDQASKKVEIAKVSGATDVYPASLSAAGVPDANGITYTYTSSNSIAPAAPQTYCLTATSNSGALRSYTTSLPVVPQRQALVLVMLARKFQTWTARAATLPYPVAPYTEPMLSVS